MRAEAAPAKPKKDAAGGQTIFVIQELEKGDELSSGSRKESKLESDDERERKRLSLKMEDDGRGV